MEINFSRKIKNVLSVMLILIGISLLGNTNNNPIAFIERIFKPVKLGADSEIVGIAALLHDYAGIKDRRLIEEHHIYGAVEAERVLSEFTYPKDRIQK